MDTSFLVLAGAIASRHAWPNEKIESFPADAGEFVDLLQKQPGDDVLLHYAGRAYHRYGFPFWMAKAFRSWRANDSRRRLHIVFHELPARLPMLTRQGIVQRLSFSVARRLAEQAATLITNSARHAALLKSWVPPSRVDWFPVPSNIPPPISELNSSRTRKRGEFVIFGLPFSRLQTIQLFRDWIASWRNTQHLRLLHLIGPRDERFSAQADALLGECLAPEAIIQHGPLPPADVSNILLEAEFCLSPATELTWSKSGTFMAYAAHSCPVITASSSSISPLDETIAAADVDRMGEAETLRKGAALREWYLRNADWDITANRVAELAFRSHFRE